MLKIRMDKPISKYRRIRKMIQKREETVVEKQNLDWANLGFSYTPTRSRYVSYYRDGKWDDGAMIADETICLHESAGVLHYAQTCFEGLKAYRTQDGRLVVFRPELNAERMMNTCERLVMPQFPIERFCEAIDKVVRENADFVPPHGSGATFYLRPYIFGSGLVFGVNAASEYTFRLFGTPVGSYMGVSNSIKLMVSSYDRAAPKGTGHVKAGINYGMSLYPKYVAKRAGYADNLYLDAATRSKVEEAGGANFLFISRDGKVVTPKSPTILPSITRRSLMQIATDYLGLQCEEREVDLSELKDFAECALCGTAAVLTPVASVSDNGKEVVFENSREKMGPISQKLYDTLLGIQTGDIDPPEGWIHVIP